MMGNIRMWVGSAGNELLGTESDGTPVLGSDEGVERMREIGGVVDLTWTPSAPEPIEGTIVECDRTRLPQAMIESVTEFDYADLPETLRQTLEAWCDRFREWDQRQP